MVDGQTQSPQGSTMAILQYNGRNANHRSARPFFDRLDPEKHHIVAVQEPYYTARTKSTYCPPGYYLAYRPDATTRVCFMVSKAVTASLYWQWSQNSKNMR